MTSNFRPDPMQGKADDLERKKLKGRLRLEIETLRLSQKAVAVGAGIDEGHFSRLLNDSYTDALAAHKLPAITRELGPGLMEWVALQCGGTYHHGEEAPQIVGSPMVLAGLLAQHSGLTLQQIIQDFQDGKWSEAECRDALPRLRKLQLVIDTLTKIAEGVAA